MTALGNPRNRVLQLDGYLLDDQITSILQTQLTDAFSDSSLPLKIQRIGSRHGKDLVFALKLILFKLFVWDKSTTYGLLLQNLKLSNGSREGLNRLGKGLILLNLVSAYLLEKFSSYLYSDEMGELETTHPKLYSVFKKIVNYLPFVENSTNFCQVINRVVFYLLGDYTSVYYRITGIKHEVLNQIGTSFASNPQAISYEFQDRQLIWNSFTEFINNISDIKMPRFITRQWNKAMQRVVKRKQEMNSGDGEDDDESMLRFLPERCCALCYSNDVHVNKSVDDNLITNPYVTNCGHIYCYFCIMRAIDSHTGDDNDYDGDYLENKWNCLRCNEKVQWCKIYTDGMDDIEVQTKQYFESEKYLQSVNPDVDEDLEAEVSSEGENADSENADSENGSEDDSEVSDGSDTDSAYEYDEDECS